MNRNFCASEHNVDRGIGCIGVEEAIIWFTITTRLSKLAIPAWD